MAVGQLLLWLEVRSPHDHTGKIYQLGGRNVAQLRRVRDQLGTLTNLTLRYFIRLAMVDDGIAAAARPQM